MLNENNLMVYPLDAELLKTVITNSFTEKSVIEDPNNILKVSADAILKVKGGFLLVNTDCCFETSGTDLLNGCIAETLHIPCTIEKRTRNEDNTGYSCEYEHFSVVMEGKLILYSYIQNAVTLKNFMGSRYKYNPRIIKNMSELIKFYNDLKPE